MKQLIAFGLAAASLTAVPPTAVAHHSFSMFDASQQVVIEGTVARWRFSSPHSFLLIEDSEGQVWAFEGSAPPSLIDETPPMTGDTFQPGDEVLVVQCPLRDGRPGGAVGLVQTMDGTIFDPSDGGCNPNDQWPEWIEAGYTSLEEAEAATGSGDAEEEDSMQDDESADSANSSESQ